ncbi:MAG: hypothetical protein WBL58_10090 [Peptococcia bacterium]|jgi:hypothetical protein
MISSIEIRSKTNKPGTGIPTSRRIFVNGQEVYGVRDITVKNKAGQYIDFLDVSLTFLVRTEGLVITEEE